MIYTNRKHAIFLLDVVSWAKYVHRIEIDVEFDTK